ncbi:MAG: hypothetical protein JNK90_13215 [Planctomycetaceae bacterium]|nr:hypothetical protein [Planctomycetaceae bacterium]
MTTIETSQLGVMKLDRRTGCYETEIDAPFANPIRFSIDAADVETGLPHLEKFAEWFKVNHQAFKNPLEYQIQNYDLVWDDVWDGILGEDWVDRPNGFLADYLIYRSVDYRSGKLYVWVDTSGLHTDHMVRATLNDTMEIECCEML